MDKTAHYRTQSVLRESRTSEVNRNQDSAAWPLWIKSWFFILSSVALWAGIYLAVSYFL